MSHKRTISLLQENESAPAVKKPRLVNGGSGLSAEDWLDLESILDENLFHSNNTTIPEVTTSSSYKTSNVTLKDSLMDLLIGECKEAGSESKSKNKNISNFNITDTIKSSPMMPQLPGESPAVLISDDDDESDTGAENVLSYHQRPASPADKSLESANNIPCDPV